MVFKHIYDTDLAQGSYLIGCQASGEAVVVDPRRDVQIYLDEAAALGLRVCAVTETHVHADYLSGARELAAATGATLYLSGEGAPRRAGDDDWRYAFEHVALHDGDAIRVGNVELTALHTPGHTPEHLSFLVVDGGLTDRAGYLLSGDFVFVGDVGRPDLLDEAAGGGDTRFAAARQLYSSLKNVFLELPDHVQVWPGHGAGSACGKALGAVPSSTVGYERVTAWWREFLARGDEDGFVAALLDGQPDAPRYFGRMKRWNREGSPLLGERPAPARLTVDEVRARLGRDLLLLDTRSEEEQRLGAVPGALTVPGRKRFASYAAWVIDPERDAREIAVLAPDAAAAQRYRDRLATVGIDRLAGYLPALDGLPLEPWPLTPPAALDDPSQREDVTLLDVRTASEHAAGHIPGARQLHGGRVAWSVDVLPAAGRLVVYCETGVRSAVVTSLLRSEGFDASELAGSYVGWLEHRGAAEQPSSSPRTDIGGTTHVR